MSEGSHKTRTSLQNLDNKDLNCASRRGEVKVTLIWLGTTTTKKVHQIAQFLAKADKSVAKPFPS